MTKKNRGKRHKIPIQYICPVQISYMSKKVPNPHGKKGGPKHQKLVGTLTALYESQGFVVITEYMIKVVNGLKPKRFVDLAVQAHGEIIKFIQVCKMNKDGVTPVKREKDAGNDIRKMFPDTPLDFGDYEKGE